MTANHTFEILAPVRGSLMRSKPSHLGQLDSSARTAEESYGTRGSILHPSNSGAGTNVSYPGTGCNHNQLRHVAGTHATHHGSLDALRKAPHPPFHC
jgi:hypothetical protein